MADAKKIIDRDTSQGRLTGELVRDGGPVIQLFLDDDPLDEGTPCLLPPNFEDQVPDKFSHIIGQVPLTEEEVEPYFNAKEKYETERKAQAQRLAEERPDAEVGLTRTQGIGWRIVDTDDLDEALVSYLSERAEAAGKELDVPTGWDGFETLTTTVGEIISAAETRRARHEAEAETRDDSYHDARHEANCGARYSASAACECGAV
jgi:hypothetical protein